MPGGTRPGERRVGALDGEADPAVLEAQRGVAQQRARHQAGLRQDLEAVADAEHEPAARGVVADRAA